MSECKASVKIASFGTNDNVNWKVIFKVSVKHIKYSRGSFEFDVMIVRDNGTTQMLRKRENWLAHNQPNVEVKHTIQLNRDESIEEAKIDERTIKCTSRELEELEKLKKPGLKVGEKVPNISEVKAVGAIKSKIKRGTTEFKSLVKNNNPDIVFKDEEETGADRMMTVKLKNKLNILAKKVKAEFPGKRLRVTEAWDENNELRPKSIHYEGRAADITVSDKDKKKLGRLGQLAVESGIDWVYYEDSSHVHVSVKK
jgi:hypothetical protein